MYFKELATIKLAIIVIVRIEKYFLVLAVENVFEEILVVLHYYFYLCNAVPVRPSPRYSMLVMTPEFCSVVDIV